MISVRGLSFEYPGVRALDDVSFSIKRGSVVALVGPNGAGKTTLLRCLAALDQPISGEILFDGEDTLENPRAAHEKIGYLPDFFGLYDDLTVERCLLFHAAAHRIEETSLPDAVRRAAERLGLADRMHMRARELSRGLRQRLAIAQAIVHEPPLLLLDEPASGLDPEARASLSQLFLELRDAGMTLMVSSHILTELQAYSSHMLVLRQGRIMGEELIGAQPEAMVPMYLLLSAADEAASGVLSSIADVSDVRVDGRRIDFLYAGDESGRYRLLKQLLDQGLPVSSFAQAERGMQRAYLDKIRGKP